MHYPCLQSYEQENWYFSAMAKAMSHPARVVIVRLLYDRGNGKTDFTTLTRLLPLADTTVSQHLWVLREAGFIREWSDGKRMTYRINRRVVTTFANGIDKLERCRRGVLAKGRLPDQSDGERSWWEDIPETLRNGSYYTLRELSGFR